MPFLHPWIFGAGAIAASAPIIIHLLNRRRFRIREWAAMQFLLDSIRKNRRRLRIEELILLLLRTLAVVMLGFALARFTGCQGADILPTGQGSQTLVYILDDSFSMQQRVGGSTVFEKARTELAEQIEKVGKTDKVAILLASDPNKVEVELQFNADAQGLADRVRGFDISDRRAKLDQALAKAAEICRADTASTKRVYLISDFRKVDLTGQENIDAIRKQYSELAALQAEVLAMDYGRPETGNRTIESIELLDRFVVANQPFHVRVGIRNNGSEYVDPAELRVSVRQGAGQDAMEIALPSKTIKGLNPGETTYIDDLKVKPSQAGPVVVTVELPSDELQADDEGHLALDVREAIRVLIVDGSPNLIRKYSESYFLQLAIDPMGDARYGTKADVVDIENFTNVPVEEYDMVILANVGSFPSRFSAAGESQYAQLPEMEEFVRSGGGLVIFTGDNIDTKFYGEQGPFWNGAGFANLTEEQKLTRKGSGLLPMPVGNRLDPPADKFWRMDPRGVRDDSVMGLFARWPDLSQLLRFYAVSKVREINTGVSEGQSQAPQVLARLDNPDRSPLAIRKRFGRGTVLLFTTTGSTAWTDWPKISIGNFNSFVVTVRETIRVHARARSSQLKGTVGEPIVHVITNELLDAVATLKKPSYPEQDLVTLAPAAEENKLTGMVQNLLRFEQVDEAGVYEIQLELPDETETFVVYARNVDPEEGQLTPGGRTDISSALGSNEYTYIDRTSKEVGAVTEMDAGKDYWMWALGVLAVMLALETFLGQRFGHYSRR